MQLKAGAGVIPFAISDGQVCFLFHKTFSGRRAGLLVDFGGGSRSDELHLQTAAREFVEETDAMFFAANCREDSTDQADSQYELMLRLIGHTQKQHPDWWCGRAGRNWKTFFVEVEYRELADMNRAWEEDRSGRFKKRREILWIASGRLLEMLDNRPEALWKRLRHYQGLREGILAIVRHASDADL